VLEARAGAVERGSAADSEAEGSDD
jgi:hypothetical protein